MSPVLTRSVGTALTGSIYPGQKVWVQDPISKRWTKCAKIVEMRNRRYLLRLLSSRFLWKNRKFIRSRCDDLKEKNEPYSHSLTISMDTSREVDDILNIIQRYLRSLGKVYIDMRDLLQIRQDEGQDYTSLCNDLRELANYADAAMANEDDRAKVTEKSVSTFEEARLYILELETSRNSAKLLSDKVNEIARVQSNYQKSKTQRFAPAT
eukprot:maker-scaffold1435_size41353-snap-gene-0.12 protein:Tk10249 transcript:maker-scaffold1435_size41353-snap-gene-0.12-mRNA-1 annotation:"hypothetical protein DAPPUDRAFT_261119"